jgi:hypothetical protein
VREHEEGTEVGEIRIKGKGIVGLRFQKVRRKEGNHTITASTQRLDRNRKNDGTVGIAFDAHGLFVGDSSSLQYLPQIS